MQEYLKDVVTGRRNKMAHYVLGYALANTDEFATTTNYDWICANPNCICANSFIEVVQQDTSYYQEQIKILLTNKDNAQRLLTGKDLEAALAQIDSRLEGYTQLQEKIIRKNAVAAQYANALISTIAKSPQAEVCPQTKLDTVKLNEPNRYETLFGNKKYRNISRDSYEICGGRYPSPTLERLHQAQGKLALLRELEKKLAACTTPEAQIKLINRDIAFEKKNYQNLIKVNSGKSERLDAMAYCIKTNMDISTDYTRDAKTYNYLTGIKSGCLTQLENAKCECYSRSELEQMKRQHGSKIAGLEDEKKDPASYIARLRFEIANLISAQIRIIDESKETC